MRRAPTSAEVEEAVGEAFEAGRGVVGQGSVARYIPELAQVDPDRFGLAVRHVDGTGFALGDCEEPFTLQSASKVFSLCAVLRDRGLELFRTLSVEPSGDAFFSIVKLEEEKGRPRNPYINAGAIMTTGALAGDTIEEKVREVRQLLATAADTDLEAFPVNEAVFRSEAETGYRNLALAAIMRHHGTIGDCDVAAKAYFRQCSISTTATGLARAGLFLANRGADPISGKRIISPDYSRRVVALMATCGMYDEVGRHAVEVGLPTKSAVSGAMLAVAPGLMTIAAYGPALGAKGNSVAGMKALAVLADKLELSLFG